MRILVLGAGGIGGYFGARLHATGADVTFMVRAARRARLEDIGLNVISPFGDLHITPKLVARGELQAHFDAVILSCKAYDLDSAMDDIEPAVGNRTLVLPLLNGVSHLDRLGKRFGREQVLGGVAQAALLVTPSGDIRHFNKTHRLVIGARCKPAPATLQRLAQILAASGVEFILADDIEQAMWNKFVFWSALAGATCTLRACIGELLQSVGGEEFVTGLLVECARVAEASGHALSDAQLATCRTLLTEKGSALAASMLRDVERGGPTEADYTLGDLVERAIAKNISVHCLRLAYSHMQAYEVRRKASAGNLPG